MEKFRKAFVLERSKKFSGQAVTDISDEIVFLLTGSEQEDEVSKKLAEGLKTFDHEVDVIIPAGRVYASLMLGFMLSRLSSFNLGIYQDKRYKFVRVYSTELDRNLQNATV